jgi:hypothetical protein
MRDWLDDDELAGQIRSMTRGKRHWAAFLALRRLQSPLTGIEFPDDWGMEPRDLRAMIVDGAGRLDGAENSGLSAAVARLCDPLAGAELDPDPIELFQLEVIGGWDVLRMSLGEMEEGRTVRIVTLAREMAHYVDGVVAQTGAGAPHRAQGGRSGGFSESVRDFGLGYFASRNLEVEFACHEVIVNSPEVADYAIGNPLNDRLGALCDDFGDELLAALRGLR